MLGYYKTYNKKDMDNSMMNKVSETIDQRILQNNPNANVEKSERLVSIGAGAFLTLKGITNVFSHPLIAMAELGIGSSLLYRGVTGYCAIKNKLEHEDMMSQSSMGQSVPVPERANPSEAY